MDENDGATSSALPEDVDNDENSQTIKKDPHKHNTGEADLEKVTDFAEEKEIALPQASALTNLEHLGGSVAVKEVTKIRKEDVDLMTRELEITRPTAERKLREHKGNVKSAIRDILKL